MANRYLKTAGGNWSSANTWSATSAVGVDNAGAPTATDNVILELLSGNVTIDTTSACRSLDTTSGVGTYGGTITHNAFNLSIGDATAGAGNVSLKFNSGITYTLSNAKTSAIIFVSTSSTQQTITTAGKTLGNITINGAGNNYQLQDNITTSGDFTYTAGTTFDTNSKSITMTGSAPTFAGASKTYFEVNLNGSGAGSVTGTNVFTNFGRTSTAVKTDSLTFSADQTISGNFTLAGNSTINRLIIVSNTLGTQRTITNTGATQIWSNIALRDIGLSTSYNASAITGNSSDCGGNTNITFTTTQTNYWVGNGGNWSDVTHWANSSGGSGSSGRLPLGQDTVIFNTSSFSGTGQTVVIDMPRIGKDNTWTPNGSHNVTFNFNSSSFTLFGSLTIGVISTSNTSTSNIVFQGRSNHTFTRNSRTIGAVTLQMVGGKLTFQDAFSMTASNNLTLTNGELDSNGFAVTILGQFSSNNANTRTLTMGNSTWTLSGTGTIWNVTSTLTVTSSTSLISITDTSSTSKTFTGGSLVYNNFRVTTGGTGVVIIQGSNTFSKMFTSGVTTKTINFTAGITTTLTGDANCFFRGIASNLITCQSTSAGNAWNLIKTSDVVACDYISLKDSHASGGATFYAGSHSTNVSGNTGWSFTDATMTEPLSFTIVSVMTETDIYTKYFETLSFTIVTVTSLNDKQSYIDLLNLIIASTVTVSDKQTYLEALNFIISSTISEDDKQTYVEILSFIITSQITLSDFQTYAENLNVVINAVLTEQDIQSYKDTLNLLIQSTITVQDIKFFVENLNLTISSTISETDLYHAIDNLNLLITSETTVTDKQHYVDNLNLLLTTITEIIEVYNFILTDFKPISLRRKTPIKVKLNRNRITNVRTKVQDPIKINLRRKNW